MHTNRTMDGRMCVCVHTVAAVFVVDGAATASYVAFAVVVGVLLVFHFAPHLTFHHIMVINHVEIKWKWKTRARTVNVVAHSHSHNTSQKKEWFITTIKTKINYIFDEHEPICVHFVTIFSHSPSFLLVLPHTLIHSLVHLAVCIRIRNDMQAN